MSASTSIICFYAKSATLLNLQSPDVLVNMINATDHVLVGDGQHFVLGDAFNFRQVDIFVHPYYFYLCLYFIMPLFIYQMSVKIILFIQDSIFSFYSSYMQSKQKYKMPKNLCQMCYQHSGRYILDCYCIICQECYPSYCKKLSSSTCPLCYRESKGNKIDAKQQSSIKRIGHLFQNVDGGLQRLLEVYKFQNQIANRYCQFLERQLNNYQNAVNQIISINPGLHGFFNSRVKLKRTNQTQQHDRNYSTNHSVRAQNTIKPNRQYASQIFESKRSTIQLNGIHNQYNQNQYQRQYEGNTSIKNPEISGVRPIGRSSNNYNHSGNIVYKVPNINYNTAIRSSKRHNENQKIGPDYDDDAYRYRKF